MRFKNGRHRQRQHESYSMTKKLEFGLVVVATFVGNLMLLATMSNKIDGDAVHSKNVNEDAESNQYSLKNTLESSLSSFRKIGYNSTLAAKRPQSKRKLQSRLLRGLNENNLDGIPSAWITTSEDNNSHLRVDVEIPLDTLCLPWTVNSDDWWTHHPQYFVQDENATHYCFARIPIQDKADLFMKLYTNQFHNNCTSVFTQRMGHSGWGADMAHIVDTLYYGLLNDLPIQVSNDRPWHYASSRAAKRKHYSNSTRESSSADTASCPLESMYCYFLNLSNCQPQNDKAVMGNATHEFLVGHPNLANEVISWIIEYITRPQTWLRKAIFDFAQSIPLKTPCTVFHVRRADVVLHGQHSRRYHALEEYMFPYNNETSIVKDNATIFLLTDDSNAIQEAHEKFPDMNWVYIDRPRFKGAEGGWENQIPSNDPKLEVIALLSTFRLVQQCHTFVYSYSNLGAYIAGLMASSGRERDENVHTIYLDEGLPRDAIFNEKYALVVPSEKK